MSKRYGDQTSLGDVLKDFIAFNKLDKGLNKISVEEAWYKLMGAAISKYTTKVILDGTTLKVRLNSSVLREELSYGKEKIKKMINEELGEELVDKIILQ